MKSLRSLVLGLALATTAGATAHAHAKLVAANPPANGVANGAIKTLDLSFSEAISGRLSDVTVKDAAGAALPATTTVAKAGKGLTVTLKGPLKPGAYTVAWHAVASDDGHRTSGTYGFTVR